MAVDLPPAAGSFDDRLRALEFLQARFAQLALQGVLPSESQRLLEDHYNRLREDVAAGKALPDDFCLRPRNQCWSCHAIVPVSAAFCDDCGAPVQNEKVDSLRYLSLLGHEINKHEKAGRLPLATAHDLLATINEGIVARRKNLDLERIPLVEKVTDGTPLEALPVRPRRTQAPALPQRPLLEILLDPRSIQWLLASGGLLLVLGLVIWLAAAGWFKNQLFVAILLGSANAVLLAGGWALIRFSRYQMAGRALTLLACLVMPLNLWFYDAQNLIPLKEGGHLWIPALVCCVLYAVSARLLRDPMLVYVFVAGITMTGLLILADKYLDRFWEITAPVSLLVSLGLLFLHTECVFPAGEGDFSRKRFGLAFFWSGHAVLAAGLLLLLGAQLAGTLLYPVFEPLYRSHDLVPAEVVTTWHGKLLALFLVLAGTYGYIYSDLLVRRIGVYIYVAVFTLLWAEVLALSLFEWAQPQEVIIITLAVTALAANLGQVFLSRRGTFVTRAGAPLGLFLSTLPVLLGVLLHFRATSTLLADWRYQLGWSYVLAMLVTAISCRVGAFLYRHEHPSVSWIYFFGTAAATMVGAAGLLVVLWTASRWEQQAPVLMLIPILYILAARLYRGHTPEKPLVWVGHAATALMLVSSLGTAAQGFVLIQGQSLNLTLALFFAEATIFYLLIAASHKQEAGVYLATAMACAAVWQVLKYTTLADEYYILAFAFVGLTLLIGYRVAALGPTRRSGLAKASFISGNVLLSLAFVAGALLVMNEVVTHTVARTPLLTLLVLLEVIGLASLYLVRVPECRRWYVVTDVTMAGLFILVLAVTSQLTLGERLEIVSVALGLLLLTAGHLGWYREREGENELVTLGLVFGCLLLAVPLVIAVLYCRLETPTLFDTFHTLNEAGMLAAGLLLLATGFLFQIRSTTLTGAVLSTLYLVTLLLYVRLPEKLQTTAVYLMIGGGVFFGAGLLLSLYRDRLLTLPERIKRREGIYRVLSWR